VGNNGLGEESSVERSWIARSVLSLAVLGLAASLTLSPVYAGHDQGQGKSQDKRGTGDEEQHDDPLERLLLVSHESLLGGPTVSGCVVASFLVDGGTPTIDIYHAASGTGVRVYLNTVQARDALFNAGLGRCIEGTGDVLSDHEFSALSGRVV
jgi:hypothetical protein